MVSLLPSDEELASFCKNNCLAGTRLVRFSDTTIIKFGLDITPAEAATQRYVWEHANQDIFHIPEPYRFFQDGPIGYLVMEYLVGTSLSTYLESASSEEQINLVNSVMEALDHLATLPVPLKQGLDQLVVVPPEAIYGQILVYRHPSLLFSRWRVG